MFDTSCRPNRLCTRSRCGSWPPDPDVAASATATGLAAAAPSSLARRCTTSPPDPPRVAAPSINVDLPGDGAASALAVASLPAASRRSLSLMRSEHSIAPPRCAHSRLMSTDALGVAARARAAALPTRPWRSPVELHRKSARQHRIESGELRYIKRALIKSRGVRCEPGGLDTRTRHDLLEHAVGELPQPLIQREAVAVIDPSQ